MGTLYATFWFGFYDTVESRCQDELVETQSGTPKIKHTQSALPL